MVNSLITILTNLIRIYLIRKFVAVFLDDAETNKKKEILFCGIFFIVSTSVYFVFHLTYINVICSILGISVLVLMRTKSVKMYLLVTFAVYFINLLCDCVVVSLFVNYTEGEEFNQVYVIVETFLIFICELLTERIVQHRKRDDAGQSMPLILVPLSSVVMMLILVGINDKKAMPVVGVGLLIINFLVLYLYDIVVQTISHKFENELLQQQIQIYANQLEVIMQSEDKVNSLRHDMKYHLKELWYLVDTKDKADALEYIDNMGSFLQNPNEIVASGNSELDSLLNYMLRWAKKSLTTVNVRINVPKNVLPAFDINVILGNLLENAIDAAQQTEDKFLDVLIQYKQGMLQIKVKNSFAGVLSRNGQKLSTTKEDKERHGIGLTSVKQIVERYDGMLKIEPQGNLFCVNIILYLSQF